MEVWQKVLNRISDQISKPSFETWLKNTTAECKDDVVFVKAKNDFQADWLDSRYKSLISKTVEEVAGKSLEIVIVGERLAFERNEFQKSKGSNEYGELMKLIAAQQQKINELEERINHLEKA
ncbi:DnaA N-terminal domain-containing protein [Bacillus sp. JJ1566]|uniref:DnaA N-terminal domain-containing protein n=1 Tax=Bacillus sp. JJ1566 TaxID=3122961 RepID=UPI002FFDCF4A